jgi:hypothetical protein
MRITMIATFLAAGCCSVFAGPSVGAGIDGKAFAPSTRNELVVRNDSGGYVVAYAMKVAKISHSDTRIRFAGRCDSACTMYLGLHRSKVCVEPGAYFRFHKPAARSAATVSAATRLLMRKYPTWVRQWIADNGGLTGTLKTMNFEYASRYLPVCRAVA